jgi:methionyl-tRNA formyltransferase
MNKEDLRIIFLGTPEFAVATLDALLKNNFNVVAVITAPDKPAGRGMELQQSAVKQYAVANNLPVLQPEKLKDASFLETLKSYNANLQIVVAFRMLPEAVWNMPIHGTYNVHGSLLPQYRGAAPINWAIINGEQETGVTTFKLVHEIDKGNILLQRTIPIEAKDDVGIIYENLMQLGAKAMVDTLNLLLDNNLTEQAQVESTNLKHAPKIYTETCKIDWNNNGVEINNLIRGLSPYPAAYTFVKNKKLKIFEAIFIEATHDLEIGQLQTDGKHELKFACKNGFIKVYDVQMEGKKRLLIQDFLRGYKF